MFNVIKQIIYISHPEILDSFNIYLLKRNTWKLTKEINDTKMTNISKAIKKSLYLINLWTWREEFLLLLLLLFHFCYRFTHDGSCTANILGLLPFSPTVLFSTRKEFVLNCETEILYLAQRRRYSLAYSCSMSYPIHSCNIRFWGYALLCC